MHSSVPWPYPLYALSPWGRREYKHKQLNKISPWDVESWRSQRKRDEISKSTINRGLDRLNALLSKAVDWNVIPAHPLRGKVKHYRVDNQILRFLSAEEEIRLREELRARDIRKRIERENAN